LMRIDKIIGFVEAAINAFDTIVYLAL
jgi:hypothetical protein